MRVVNVSGFQSIEDFLAANPHHAYVGRPSPLGNPYRVKRKAGEQERAAAIESYRRWLWGKIQARDRRVLTALQQLTEESILGCWCFPKSCHADVVMRAWAWMMENPDALRS